MLTAASWTRRNREGRKIAISSYVNSMMDTLEACEEKGIYVKPGVWRKMLGSRSREWFGACGTSSGRPSKAWGGRHIIYPRDIRDSVQTGSVPYF